MWLTVHAWAWYDGREWEMYGVWFRTPGFPALEAIWRDIGFRISKGPSGQGMGEPDSVQVLVQQEDSPPKDGMGEIIPQTDLSFAVYANPRWVMIPNPSFDQEDKPNGTA